MAFARIVVPPSVTRGAAFEVRVSIRHPMETGFRVDDVGATIPRNTLREVTVRYAGAVVLRGRLGSGVAANPYLRFHVTAQDSGPLTVDWVDDAGEAGHASVEVRVTA
jgi:thiosulfate oxidation carrier complex protein SoxZ